MPSDAYPEGGRFPSQNNDDWLVRRAAGGDVNAAIACGRRDFTFNSDQWNWFRWQENGDETTTDLFPEHDRGYLMTATEYLNRRVAARLAR